MAWIRMGGGASAKTPIIYENGEWKDGFHIGGNIGYSASIPCASGMIEESDSLRINQVSWEQSAGGTILGNWNKYAGAKLHIEAKLGSADYSLVLTLPQVTNKVGIVFALNRSNWSTGYVFLGATSNITLQYISQFESKVQTASTGLNGYPYLISKIWIEK